MMKRCLQTLYIILLLLAIHIIVGFSLVGLKIFSKINIPISYINPKKAFNQFVVSDDENKLINFILLLNSLLTLSYTFLMIILVIKN
jgi:hypothetical protein